MPARDLSYVEICHLPRLVRTAFTLFSGQTVIFRYGGDWHGDSLDLLVEALGPQLTKLQLHYVENFDLAAIATVAHCCQGLKSLEVAALVGSRYVGEGYEEEPYIAQIRRMEETEVGLL